MCKTGGSFEVHAPGAGAVGVQKRDATERTACLRAWNWNDQIAEHVSEVGRGNANSVGSEILVEAGIDGATVLRAQVGISRAARISVEGFERGWFFDSLPVSRAQTRVSQEAFGIAQSEHGTGARHNARAKTGVRFGAASGA